MNKPHTQETKDKIRLARLGQKLSETHRLKVIKTLRHDSGSANPNWKGGRIRKGAYIQVRMPEHPNAIGSGYVTEHRLVMEESMGRYLLPNEDVHHLNGIRDDNRVENLVVLTKSGHGKEHWVDVEKRKERSRTMKEIRRKNPWSTKTK